MLPKDFRFGIGLSSYQVEGGKEFREECIWDEYCRQEGKILDKTLGDEGIDFYNKYKIDVALAKELGIKDFRFSLSWPRLVDKEGKVNNDGLLFYKDLIKTIKEAGMNPVITLYHWDMPSYLMKKGGWTNREILNDFARFAEVAVKSFAKDVDIWLTFNEPQCFLGLGYTGLHHAPGILFSYHELLMAAHHVLLAHALAYELIKKENPSSKVSFVNTFAAPIPKEENPQLEGELQRKLFSLPVDNRSFYTLSLFMDPLFLGHYPEELKRKDDCSYILKGDMEKIALATPDFMALNIYTGAYFALDEKGKVVEAPSPYSDEEESGDLPWLKKRPEALKYGIKYLYNRYPFPILISENGACYKDHLENGEVHDEKRGLFIKEYLSVLDEVIKDGYPVFGYYYWSLLDNYEWSEGFSKRFGLVYVDYDDDYRRYRKGSFFAYKSIIEKAGKEE